MPTNIAPSIRVYQPISISVDFIGDYGRLAKNYRQTTRMMGGYWSSSWDMTAYPDPVKLQFYNRRISSRVATLDGGAVVWVGFIWEMELYNNGVLRRISMDKVRNAIKCVYTDQADDTRKETAYFTNAESISRYGRIEDIVYLDKAFTATAESYAQTNLQEQQWPVSRVVSTRAIKEEEEMQLRVRAVGYVQTGNYKYLSISDISRNIGGSAGAISVTLSTDMDFIRTGSIATNTILVRPPEVETKAWDWITEIAEIGDGTTPYTLQVYYNRAMIYKPIDPEPTLYYDGKTIRSGLSQNLLTNKYAVRPGVFKDLTVSSAGLSSTDFMINRQNSIVHEVEAGQNYALPILKSDDYNDSELMAAYIQSQIDLLEERD